MYDRMERLRDPSHTRALPPAELESLFAGLTDVRRAFYRYPVGVDELLSRSFPDPGGADRFREMVAADVGVDRIGIGATRDEDWGSRSRSRFCPGTRNAVRPRGGRGVRVRSGGGESGCRASGSAQGNAAISRTLLRQTPGRLVEGIATSGCETDATRTGIG